MSLRPSSRRTGDAERLMRFTRARDGVPIDAETWAQIVEAGAEVGAIVSA